MLCIEFSEVKTMKNHPTFPGILAAVGMLALILDSEASLAGAAEGVDLCIRTVIPSLFPFFILSGILVREWTGRTVLFLRPLGRLLGMPAGSESVLITGFLGGYPVGAKAVRDAWVNGSLSEKDANRLLSFCSNAGPAFLFGMASPMFADSMAGWMLWGIQIASALFVGILFRKDPDTAGSMPVPPKGGLSDSLQNAVSVTAQVCGWVICFRILTTFANRWVLWLLPQWFRVFFTGFLELANGCLSLSAVEKETVRFLLCSAMLSWGGLCVAMQTAAVTRGLKLSCYLTGKLLQTGFSLLLSLCYQGLVSPLLPVFLIVLVLGCKTVKKGSNPGAVGV